MPGVHRLSSVFFYDFRSRHGTCVGIAGSYTAIPMGLVMVFGEVGAFLSYIRFIAPHHRNKG